jgi:tetratricopeptide repeat protein
MPSKSNTLVSVLSALTLLAGLGFAQETPPPKPAPEASPSKVPSMAEANQSMQAGKWKEATMAYTQIVLAQPDNGMAWSNLGYCLHAQGDLDRALRVHQKAATFPAGKAIALYNIACVHALRGETDQAFELIKQARQAGPISPQQFSSDGDLKSLHQDPRWAELMAELGIQLAPAPPTPEVALAIPEAAAATETATVKAAPAVSFASRGGKISLPALAPKDRFNFWLGEWDVYTAAQKIDHWSVTQTLNGNAMVQKSEQSMTILNFEPTTQKWQATWISKEGAHDVLEGGLEGSEQMVLHQGLIREQPGSVGRWILSNPHQNYFAGDWQVSGDHGKTWQSQFTMQFVRTDRTDALPNKVSDQAPEETRQFGFLVGDWDLSIKSMTADQEWVEGTGSLQCKLAADGITYSGLSKIELDGQAYEGTTRRVFNPDRGSWDVYWTSKDQSQSKQSSARMTGSGMIEYSNGVDQLGSYQDEKVYSKISKKGFEVQMNRVYPELDRRMEALFQVTATRRR